MTGKVIRKRPKSLQQRADNNQVGTEGPDFRTLLPIVRQFKALKNQLTFLDERMNMLKARIAEAVDNYGDEDDKGHLFLELPESVDGVTELKRQKRVGQYLDRDKAEALLKEKKLLKRCTVLVPQLDEEEILKAGFEGLITDDELRGLYGENITWATMLVEEK